MSDEKELKPDEKITVINIAPWKVSFVNSDNITGTSFAPNGSTRVRREELMLQAQRGNKLIAGLDEYGSHATLFIDDEDTRKYLEFDSFDGKRKQNVLTKEKVLKWFELKTFSAFEKHITEQVVTRAEKRYLMKLIQDLKLNDYDKITFCNDYCKFKIR